MLVSFRRKKRVVVVLLAEKNPFFFFESSKVSVSVILIQSHTFVSSNWRDFVAR